MAIVDRINKMTVDLGGDPTGGTIEDALNNLKKVSGGAGSSNEIVVGYDVDDESCLCEKSLRELMDLITSDDGKTIDIEKALSINAKVVVTASRVIADVGGTEYYTLETYPALMRLFTCNGDVAPWILNEYNSIKDSINIDDYLSEESELPEDFRVIFSFAGVGRDETYYIGYNDPDVDGFDRIIHLIRRNGFN